MPVGAGVLDGPYNGILFACQIKLRISKPHKTPLII